MKWKPEFFKDLNKDSILLALKILSISIIYIFYILSITMFQLFMLFGKLSMSMYDNKNKKVYKGKKYNNK